MARPKAKGSPQTIVQKVKARRAKIANLSRQRGHGLSTRGSPAVGAGFNPNAADLEFILEQIQSAEAHANSRTPENPCGTHIGTGEFQIPEAPNTELQPFGLRTVDGPYNNLVPGQVRFRCR